VASGAPGEHGPLGEPQRLRCQRSSAPEMPALIGAPRRRLPGLGRLGLESMSSWGLGSPSLRGPERWATQPPPSATQPMSCWPERLYGQQQICWAYCPPPHARSPHLAGASAARLAQAAHASRARFDFPAFLKFLPRHPQSDLPGPVRSELSSASNRRRAADFAGAAAALCASSGWPVPRPACTAPSPRLPLNDNACNGSLNMCNSCFRQEITLSI
jgi:hypothetical protein